MSLITMDTAPDRHSEPKTKVKFAVIGHDLTEVRADINSLLGRWADWLGLRYRAFWLWYHLQPRLLKLFYGVTISPFALISLILGFVFVKIGGPILLALALALKLGAGFVKIALLVGYIAYKVVKLLLIGYYSVSRSLSGNKARRKRIELARENGFTVHAAGAPLRFRCQGKNLYVGQDGMQDIRVLFSYWRYAIRGQRALFKHLKQDWPHYLTLWQPASRSLVASALAPVGASIFAPHKLGAHVTPERVLVPGDAELDQVAIIDGARLDLHFAVRWVDWHIDLPTTLKLPGVRREHRLERWEVAFTPVALPPLGDSRPVVSEPR